MRAIAAKLIHPPGVAPGGARAGRPCGGGGSGTPGGLGRRIGVRASDHGAARPVRGGDAGARPPHPVRRRGAVAASPSEGTPRGGDQPTAEAPNELDGLEVNLAAMWMNVE